MSTRTSADIVDLETRDRLVMEHVGLVKALASRLAHRVPPQVEVSELVSVGVLGLINAAGRYQPSLGVPFDAFARRRIHGAMLDALRELDWAPRSLRRLRRRVDAAVARLRHDLKREPSEREVASALELSEAAYRRVVEQLRSADLAFVSRATAERHDEFDEAVDPHASPHADLERSELRALLSEALADLPARERRILALYYHDELTLAEIGRLIGVGESRVSQLRAQAVARLRTSLGSTLRQGPAFRRAA